MRPLLTATAVTLTMLLAGAAACGPKDNAPTTVDDLFRKTDVYGQPKIKIGVAEDQPLMGKIVNGRFEGFDIEIARYLAESLGFQETVASSGCRCRPRTARTRWCPARCTWWWPATR
ncbi:hypothetical protein ACFQZ4_35355 [Catellatospora coxensis]